ncbi:putative glycerol dehydrogenase Gcy1 [Pseudomassariella vexata]|uniref:Putative glycerol dehydrogenase Gcy1 n=1 Tax=Pseudomassariella vexata TaxID=1141098 RepID=A0A1Y2DEB8_9PEZI|nr:putative glycerol dehydrogenase Gcy1 [Pseudomassariella vexata]ORY57444.1 putative glycerol dehydrogenase Gcy1 [Pseudomassariella vexata]
MAELQNSKKTYTLASGDKIPAIGLGTWQSPKDQTINAVKSALQSGYRYIDTAFAYGNEEQVGEGIRASGVPREQIWITTKLDNPWHKRVAEGIDTSLKNLGVEYVDLYLMHWPCSTDPDDLQKHLPDWDFIKTWAELQKLVGTGKVRNIGVSNFGIKNLEKLLNDPSCKHTPAVNQIELHPKNSSPKLVQYCKEKGIHVTGYSCLGSTKLEIYKEPEVTSVADQVSKRIGKEVTPQQVMLQWGIQNGWDVIPKSVTPERIAANFALDGWSLEKDELEKVTSLGATESKGKMCGDDWLPIKVFFGDDY